MANVSVIKLKIRRGTDLQRQQIVLDIGELGYVTDSYRVFVGDGLTQGGIPAGSKYFTASPSIPGYEPLTRAQPGDLIYDQGSTKFYVLTSSSDKNSYASYRELGATNSTIVADSVLTLLPATTGIRPTPSNSCSESTATYSAVLWGQCNSAYGNCSVIAGGRLNKVYGSVAGVFSGCNNQACSDGSTIAGGQNNSISGNNGFIGAGTANCIIDSQFSTIVGGNTNTVCGTGNIYSTIIGGTQNIAYGNSSFIVSGSGNRACGNCSGIVGGNSNCALSSYSVVINGINNVACNTHTSVVNGCCNRAFGLHSTVIGGLNNCTAGDYSFVAGGSGNCTQSFTNTYILGRDLTSTANDYTFVNNLSTPGNLRSNCIDTTTTIRGGTITGTNVCALYLYGDGSGLVNVPGTGGGGNSPYTAAQNISGYWSNEIGFDADTSIYSRLSGSIVPLSGFNTLSAFHSVINGGYCNTIQSLSANKLFTGYDGTPSTAFAGIFAGYRNTIALSGIESSGSIIIGGSENTVIGSWNTIIGGQGNRICTDTGWDPYYSSFNYNSILGGFCNQLSFKNNGVYEVEAFNNTIRGGSNNCICTPAACTSCCIYAAFNSINDGENNRICDASSYNFINGGTGNTINTAASAVIGASRGLNNAIFGGFNNTIRSGLGGCSNEIFTGDQNQIISQSSPTISRCCCGPKNSVIVAGNSNQINSNGCCSCHNTIGNGSSNRICLGTQYSTIINGCCNTICNSTGVVIAGGSTITVCNDTNRLYSNNICATSNINAGGCIGSAGRIYGQNCIVSDNFIRGARLAANTNTTPGYGVEVKAYPPSTGVISTSGYGCFSCGMSLLVDIPKDVTNTLTTDNLYVTHTRATTAVNNDWWTSGWRLQSKSDINSPTDTWNGWIQFNGYGNGSISFGAGSSSCAVCVPEEVRITSSGLTVFGDISATGNLAAGSKWNLQTANYTILDSDCGGIIALSSDNTTASFALSATIPNNNFKAGYQTTFVRAGSAVVKIAVGPGVNLRRSTNIGISLATIYSAGTVVYSGDTNLGWILFGDLI